VASPACKANGKKTVFDMATMSFFALALEQTWQMGSRFRVPSPHLLEHGPVESKQALHTSMLLRRTVASSTFIHQV
jgi:hypothetical protein